jgi:hypothetical protein
MRLRARLDRLDKRLPPARDRRPMTAAELARMVAIFRALGKNHTATFVRNHPQFGEFVERIWALAESEEYDGNAADPAGPPGPSAAPRTGPDAPAEPLTPR